MKKVSFYITTFCLLFASSAFAQNYEKMREEVLQKQENTRTEISKLNEQINTYEQRLAETTEKYSTLYEQFQNLQRLIALRDEKISKLQTEQSQLEDEIALTTQSIAQNQQKLERLIENYKETLRYVYKHGQASQLALLFASSSINQMLIRAYYLEKFSTFREGQAKDIRETEEKLKRDRAQLEEARADNKELLVEIRDEKNELAKKKQQQESNVDLLRRDKVQLQNKLDEIQEQKQTFSNTLSSLIAEEEKIREAQRQREAERQQKLAEAENIEDDAERAREVAKYANVANEEEFLSDEQLAEIESSFAQSKGHLPWPVASSTISEHFGNRRHPVYGTITPNLGIVILTEPREPVKAVHPGYVIAIQPFRYYGDVVLVKHGRFITAYGNLSEISVRDGSILQKGDLIGRSGDQDSTNGESVFFLVRRDNQTLDPEDWLQNK